MAIAEMAIIDGLTETADDGRGVVGVSGVEFSRLVVFNASEISVNCLSTLSFKRIVIFFASLSESVIEPYFF